MHFLAALLLFADLIWLSQAKTTGVNGDKDSTILLTNNGCPQCPEQTCSKCTLGTAESLHANATPEHLSRILVGFTLTMPAYQIKRCTLHTSRIVFDRKSSFDIKVYAADTSYWEEETVTAENAPVAYQIIDTITVGPEEHFIGPIDLTPACQSAAADGRFSIYLSSVDTSFYLWSHDISSEHMIVVEYEE